jgi:nucleoid DNA-binding protein
MTKKEIIIKASAKSGLTQVEIFKCVTPFLEAMSDALLNGETIWRFRPIATHFCPKK